MVVIETIVEERPGGLPIIELIDVTGAVAATVVAEISPWDRSELTIELSAKQTMMVKACRYVVNGVTHMTRLSTTAALHPNDTLRVTLHVTDHLGDPLDDSLFGATIHVESRIV